jgi:hypothetical protein
MAPSPYELMRQDNVGGPGGHPPGPPRRQAAPAAAAGPPPGMEKGGACGEDVPY